MRPTCTLALLAGVAALAASAALAAGKTPATAKAPTVWKAALTPTGQPDLQGNWTNATLTPFERPKAMGARLELTPQEIEAVEGGRAAFMKEGLKPTDPKLKTTDLPEDCGLGFKGADCGYNSFWIDPGTRMMTLGGKKRASILVEPADGRMPAMTDDGKTRMAVRMAMLTGPKQFESPEYRMPGDRCITSFGSSAGPPMIPSLYNNNYAIVQTPEEVAIQVEMVHEVRHIPISTAARPLKHPAPEIRTWLGDSIGHWEGQTLVIDTTNIRREQAFRGGADDMHVTEWLTRVSPTQMLYRFRIEDPQTYTAPYVGEVAFNASKGPIYEYACHEGNYALEHILAGAREKEKHGETMTPVAASSEGG